ncbi:MAG: carboxypeptidase-like regulatory domain-containing protein [Candidatus Paceibacterota bacterium]|jgi:hypothetical protein
MAVNLIKGKVFLLGILVSMIFFVPHAFASETNGTIDGTYKYAWGENIGWLNFGCNNCNVSVTDTDISGFAWNRQFGWIKLNPSTSGVKNNGEGVLSGYAWSSNLGWINFTGVTIDEQGYFSGYASVKSDNSRINFSCTTIDSCNAANFKVKTDWKKASLRSTSGGGGGGGGHPPWTSNPTPTPTPVTPPVENPVVTVTNEIGKTIKSTSVSALDFFLNFFRPKTLPQAVAIEIPKIAPPSFKTKWYILPVKAINQFVFAPLPYEVRVLASKFPELANTLKSVGIERLTDISKLNGVTLNLPGLTALTNTLKGTGVERLSDINKLNGVGLNIPGLSDINGQLKKSVGTGKIALVQGLPLAKFSLSEKKNLPSEFVFARTSGELVDLNVALSVGKKGDVTQQISSLPGQTLKLVVKPISKAKSVTGYFVFKSATPKITQNIISRSLLTASALFSTNDLVEKTSPPAPLLTGEGGQRPGEVVENKLVLSSFEYTDPDGDGIYTADVATPVVPGEYEVITVINYVDPVLGTRQMRMITVVDPEGYVFEKTDGKETRIPSAIVSLYYLNNSTKKYELWPAKDYQQENPQVTDIRGTYSFLVPGGSYYFEVVAPGYDTYQGKVFLVEEGSGVHQNIEMKSGRSFLSSLDWKTVLLFVVLLLLVYNPVVRLCKKLYYRV